MERVGTLKKFYQTIPRNVSYRDGSNRVGYVLLEDLGVLINRECASNPRTGLLCCDLGSSCRGYSFSETIVVEREARSQLILTLMYATRAF